MKKRRISGRDQISSGGQHLIDGVPFGRPRLRAPRGRPAVHIAPRKRRRLTYDGDFGQDDIDDDDQGEDVDGELTDQYVVSRHQQEVDDDVDEEEEEQPLLLTQHGEPKTRKDNRHVHFPRSVTASAEFEDADSQDDLSEDDEDTGEEYDQDEDMFEPDSEDLREELRGLAEEAADNRPGEKVGNGAEVVPPVPAEVNDFGPFEDSEPESSKQRKQPNIGSRNRSSHNVSDKVIAVRSAFPAVPGDVCEKLLVKHNHDVGSVWKKLAQQLKPRLDLAQTMVLNTQLELPKEVMFVSSPPRNPTEAPGEVSRIGDEDDDSTDGISSADENDDEDEEDEESEAHATSSESENDESSDSSDASARDAPAPSRAFGANDADSSSSSSEGSDSSDDDEESEAGDRPTNLGETVRSGKGASSNENQSTSDPTARLSTGLRNRRRRMVIESSPAGSCATNTKSDAGSGNTTVPARLASPSNATDSSSSESDSDDESDDDSDESQSDSSDSPSDSSSSSDSSSDSDSETELNAPSKTKGPKTSHPTKATPSAPAGPSSAASQSCVQKPVAPGQGMTKTQRRNARRRVQMAAQRAAKGVESPQAPVAQDTDLIAKKQALLKSLGVSLAVSNDGDEPAADRKTAMSLEKPPKILSKGKEDPDAWRKKISYRAVECVNEGAELTEPPFPFVQRWDSSQRRGKRKSRDDSQFYDGSIQSPKKRKHGQLSRQHADDCGNRRITSTWNGDDVTLNYDDEPVGLDRGKADIEKACTGHTVTADEDDLPSLPADMSLLPQLSPDDIQPGLVIAWKQLLLTKANNWQPQLSNFMTAVITEVDGGGDFQIQLAKRDRDIDKNEKEYDDEGGRVYAKFEVPDDDEGDADEADLGFRDIHFTEMIDPRIILRPSDSNTETKTYQPREQDVEVADSQQDHKLGTSNNSTSNTDQSKTMDMDQDGQGDKIIAMNVDNTDGSVPGEHSFVSETNHDVFADEIDAGSQPDIPAEDVSISEERRNEISQLINDGGFRQGVRTSLDQLTLLQFGSPSRQLEEEASSILPSRQLQSSHRSSSEPGSEEAPSEYGSKDPSQQDPHLAAAVPVLDDFHSAHQSPSQLGAKSNNDQVNGDASSHTYSKSDIEYPKLNISFTSQTSARSGRQIDPDFITHSDELGHGLPDDSAIMNGFDDDDVPFNDSNPDERGQIDGAHHHRTPTQEFYNDDLPQAQDATAPLAPFGSRKTGPQRNGRPSSADSASTGSSSIFVDFELLGSQPATTKFKEYGKGETAGSQTEVKGEPPSQATQGMAGIPKINESRSPAKTRTKSPETGRNQSFDGTPVSQRSRHLTRPVQQSTQDTNDEESVSQRTRRSSRLMSSTSSSPVATKAENARRTKQHSTDGSPTPNGKSKSFVTSFEASVSPPALPKPRREPARAASRSQRG